MSPSVVADAQLNLADFGSRQFVEVMTLAGVRDKSFGAGSGSDVGNGHLRGQCR